MGIRLFYGTSDGDPNRLYRISIDDQEIASNSKTLARAKTALEFIRSLAAAQPDLVTGPFRDDFSRLASIVIEFDKAKLPLLRSCPGYLSHNDISSPWRWYTTMDGETQIIFEQRFSVARVDTLDRQLSLLSENPELLEKLRDTFTDPDHSPPLDAEMLGAMRDIHSVMMCLNMNERFLAAIGDDKAAKLVRTALEPKRQELEGHFRPDPDEISDPGTWVRKVGDIKKVSTIVQLNLFDTIVVEPRGEYQSGIPEIMGPVQFAFKLHRLRSMFTTNKMKLQNWNKVSRLISREFQERFESLYTFQCTLQNGAKIVTNRVSELYVAIVAAQMAGKEKITEKDVLSATETARKTIQGIVQQSYNAVFDVFREKFRQIMKEYTVDEALSESPDPGQLIPKAPPREQWETGDFAARFAKLFEQFNLELSKWLRDNDPEWKGPNKERTVMMKVGNQKKLVVTIGDKCRVSLAYTDCPDMTTVHFTGSTRKTVTQNVLDKFYDTDCTRRQQWSEYVDDLVYRREEILEKIQKACHDHIDGLQRAAARDAEDFSQILQTDFSEELFEDYCTAGPAV